MLTYIVYAFVYSHPVVSFLIATAYIVFVVFVFLKWKQFASWAKVALLSAAFVPVLVAGLIWSGTIPESSSNSISGSDYMGGCTPERYINGDCMLDSVKRSHANFYPLVTEDDGVWKKLENYRKEDLMKTAEQELERLKKGQYKGQQEQVARVQSFIDILSKR